MGRHEQQSALRGQNMARTREATHCTSSTRVAREVVLFELYDKDTAGWRPPCLGEPQERIQQHTMEQMLESFVPVPMLDHDAPVPRTVDQLVGVLQILNMSTPVEQGFRRAQERAVPRAPQLVEQLVDVPVPSFHVFHHGAGMVLGRRWLRMGPVLHTR